MIRLTPPTVPRYVSSGWGAPREYRGGWHAGLDFPAKKGSPMLAAAPGKVAFVKNVSTSYAGKYTVLDHGSGVFSRYLHANTNTKKVGDKVARGEQIGTVGTTGTTHSGAHVHFDVKMQPAAAREYAKRYGQPDTGFSGSTKWGVGVPVEALMDGAEYRPGVLEASIARGVKIFKSNAIWVFAGVALVGWALHKHVFAIRR